MRKAQLRKIISVKQRRIEAKLCQYGGIGCAKLASCYQTVKTAYGFHLLPQNTGAGRADFKIYLLAKINAPIKNQLQGMRFVEKKKMQLAILC